MIVIRRRHLLFTSCLCAVLLVPFFIFPSATTHSSFLDLWPTEEWAEATSESATINAPFYPPESEANIQEDPQAVRKRFQQVHLSIHNNENAYIDAIEKGRRGRVGASSQMGITWVDNLALPPSSEVDPTGLVTSATDDLPPDNSAAVKYGLSEGDYPFTASASTHTYHHGGWKGLIHDVLLPDLRPSTRYYYRVGNLRSDEWSDEFRFTSPPLPPFLLPRSSYPIRLHSSSSSSISSATPSSSTLSFSSSFSSFFASSSSSSSIIDTSSLSSSSSSPSSQLPRATHAGDDDDHDDDGPNTVPAVPESPVLASLAVFGDNGISGNGQKVITRIREDPAIDAVVHVGDFAYSLKKGGGKWTVDSEQYAADKQTAWDMWFRMVEPLAAYKPYMAVPGNHETYRFDFHFVPFAHRFFMPGENSGFWYWFDYSSIHFVAVSSDHNYTRGSDQYVWLDAHLAEFNRARNDWMRVHKRTRRPREDRKGGSEDREERERERNTAWWLVVLVHRAMYSSSVEQGSVLHLRHELEPLFNKHGVDIVVHGHDHNYERTHPVVKEKAQRVERSDGVYVKSCAEQMPPIYLRSGTGGIELGSIWDPQPSWSAVVFNQAYGYMRFTAYANNTLKTEFVSAQDAQVKDTLVLIKDPLVQCDRGSFGSSSAEDYSPWWLLFGVGLALSVACQARYCRRSRRRVFDMQHFFNANGSGGYITSTWAS